MFNLGKLKKLPSSKSDADPKQYSMTSYKEKNMHIIFLENIKTPINKLPLN